MTASSPRLALGDLVRSVKGDWTHEVVYRVTDIGPEGIVGVRTLRPSVTGAARGLRSRLRWGEFEPVAPVPGAGGLR